MMRKLIYIAGALAVVASVGQAQRAHNVVSRASSVGHAAGVLSIPVEDPADSLYRLGREAQNDGDYRRAANLFQAVVDRFPNAKIAGDALYWRAWSLYQLGSSRRTKRDLDDALASIDRQQRDYKNATTSGDSRDLRARIQAAQA